jgi:hypothetical protein
MNYSILSLDCRCTNLVDTGQDIEKKKVMRLPLEEKQVNGGQCLVTRENVCKPLDYGGLGIKNLHLHGLALRMQAGHG